jgi:FkbH-like protein
MTPRSVTAMRYAEILAAHRGHRLAAAAQRYGIRVLSNISLAPLKEILELELWNHGVAAQVSFGGYDTIVQDSLAPTQAGADIVFWELANCADGLASRAACMTAGELADLEANITQDLDFLFQNLRVRPCVLFNRFSATLFSPSAVERSALEDLADRLNGHVARHKPDNLLLVDIEKCIADVSTQRAVDWRLWGSARLLYTTDFLRSYAAKVCPVFRTLTGRARKVLVLDCDNTLWDGVLGEDGIDGIGMDPTTTRGRPFADAQRLALSLQQRGVLIGLCSKNNAEDVAAVISSHPQMVLRDEHIAIRRVNWNNKVGNLREIAAALNVGLDSIVFVDDSDFEAGLVESLLPEVMVVRVPPQREQYAQTLRQCRDAFWSPQATQEDRQRTVSYRQQAERADEATRFSDMGDYLKSLQLTMTVYADDAAQTARMSQLTQKTNQFNLTTRRYSEAQVSQLLGSDRHTVFTFGLGDRFGDLGITGLAIVAIDPADPTLAEIDSFLLSCRALGRGAEQKFLTHVLRTLSERGIAAVTACHVATSKNAQTASFFDDAGFDLVREVAGRRDYRLELRRYEPKDPAYIQLNRG